MCFSATASFVAGATLSAAGVVTVRKAKKSNEIPLAVIPLLFGLQQLTEGLVWLSLTKNLTLLHIVATQVYVLFSHVLWPILVPIAIGLVEKISWRKKVIAILGAIGLGVGLYNLYFVTFLPINSEIAHHSINYILSLPQNSFIMILYVIVTCFSCLLSSHRLLRILGILAAVSLVIAYYFYTVTLASVWCFFAAILSLIIFLFFKQKKYLNLAF